MNLRSSWIVWYAIILHIVWGIVLLLSGVPTRITAIYALNEVVNNHVVLGLIMIIAGVLACVGIYSHKTDIKTLVLVLPQQFLLIMSMLGAMEAIDKSSFADGVIRPREFIFCDQFPAILASVLHTVALLQSFGQRLWNKVL